MKEIIKKIFAILVLFILTINSSFLIVVSTAIDAIENLIDESKIKPVIEVNLEKYVNYNLADEPKGVLLQANIKTGIEYEEDQEYTPIKATKVNLKLPQIEGKYPDSLELLTMSTKATNGDENGKDVIYNYDKETGNLQVVVGNKENDNGEIYTQNINDARDEFIVICNYNEESYSDESVERTLNFEGTIEEVLANEDTTKISNDDYTTNFEVAENISDLISTEVTTSDIYNGYINANIQNNTEYQTEYTEEIEINIGYKEISDEIEIIDNNYFINEQDQKINTEDIIYKNTVLNKNNVLDILGQEGILTIQNENGEKLLEINKDTQAESDGTIKVDYTNEERTLIIKTTKPQKIGMVNIINTKAIKETMKDLENDKIQTETKINCYNNIIEKDEETQEIIREYTEEIYNYENTNEIEIKKSVTKIDVSLDKNNWTNATQNEVNFNLSLNSNNIKYNLFKNPVIEIKLPNEVEKVILGEVKLLYDNNLVISNAEVIEKENSKVIQITISGSQTEYISTDIVNGPLVVIPATIILNKEIETKETNIEVTYANESAVINDYLLEGNGYKNVGVKLNNYSKVENVQVGNTQVGAVILNEDDNDTSSENIGEDISVDVVAQVGNDVLKDGDTVYEGEVITYTVKVTNNSDKAVSGLSAVATVPENTVYVTKDGSWNMYEGDVEYSSRNELFIEDVEKKQIIFNIENLNKKEEKDFLFQVRVTNIEDEIKNINLHVNLLKNDVNINQKDINLNGKDGQLKVEIYPADFESSIYTNNMLVYDILVKNLTEKTDIHNVNVEIKLEKEYNIYYLEENDNFEYDEEKRLLKINLGDIYYKDEDNSEKLDYRKFSIKVGADNIDTENHQYDVPISAIAYSEDSEDVYRSNVQMYTVKSADIVVMQFSDNEGEKLYGDQYISYNVQVKNIGAIRGLITIKDILPNGLTPYDAVYEYYDLNAETEQWEKKSKTYNMQLSPDEYDLNYETFIFPGETLSIKINAQVDRLEDFCNIENIIVVSGVNLPTKYSNGIKNTIVPWGYEEENPENPENPEKPETPGNPETPDNPENPGTPDNPENPGNKDEEIKDPEEEINSNKVYNVSGLVWLDSNKNSQRDNNESLLSGIKVKLFNADTSSIVTDEKGNKLIVTTDNNGKYNFEKIKKGNYIVLFEFDTNTYKLTTYQKSGISENLNSDVILKEVSIDGDIKNVGVTDILKLEDNLTNIDMGLEVLETVDFSIEKYVSKIKIENDKPKEYMYENSKLAKVEIASKLISSTKITIEYKIIVKNEGNISGYVTEVIDNVPNELEFESALNEGWTIENQKVINKSLSDVVIQPGESKELTIIFSKELNENEIGKICNNVEIGNVYSNVGNTEQNVSNNKSDAEVIISIKTGIVGNVAIMLVLISILLLLGYIAIKRKHLLLFINLILIIFFVAISGENTTSAWTVVDSYTFENGTKGKAYYLFYPDLGAHVWNGQWTIRYEADEFFMCVSPGKHLGSHAESDYHTGESYGLCIGGGHVYKKVAYSYKKLETFAEFEEYLNSKAGVYSGISVFESWFKPKDGNASTSKDVSPNDNQYELKNNKLLVGPFKYTTTLNNAEINSTTLKVLNGTSEISYELYDSSKNNKITNVSSGSEFYILVPTYAVDLKIELTQNLTIHKSNPYVEIEEYEFKELTGAPAYCRRVKKDNKGNVMYDSDGKKILETLGSKMPGYDGSYDNIDPQKLWLVNKKPNDSSYNTDITTSWTWKVDRGNLRVEKKDTDSGNYLRGATFIIGNSRGLISSYTKGSPSSVTYVGAQDYEHAMKFSTTAGSSYCTTDGVILLENIEATGYTVMEWMAPDGYNLNLQNINGETPKVEPLSEGKATFYNKKYGNLTINKVDYDSNDSLSGAEFRISLAGNYIKSYTKGNDKKPSTIEFTTNINEAKRFSTTAGSGDYCTASGKIQLINIPIGVYKIEEVKAPDGYNLALQQDKTKSVNVEASDPVRGKLKIAEVTIRNRQYGNLEIQKIDQDTGNPMRIAGFTFKIYTSNGYISSYTNGSPSTLTYTSNENAAMVFSTDANGIIRLNNIPIHPDTYYVKEVGVPSSLQNYYPVKDTADAFKVENNTVTSVTYKSLANKQKWTDVSGYVWEDIVNKNKTTTRNNLYKDSSIDDVDKLVGGVTVRLKHINGTTIATTTTGSDGTYIFRKVEIAQLPNYYIEFEYNGLKYESVATKIDKSNGSKAIEKTTDRINFNNSYSSITGNSVKGTSTTGYSQNQNGTKTNNLTYKNGTYSSSLVDNTSYSVGSANGYVSAQNGSAGVVMTANTKTAEYTLKWTAGTFVIPNVNFGIYEREQPDMAIATDLNSIDLTLNGYSHTYSYNQRIKATGIDIFSQIDKWNKTEQQKKEQENNGYKRTYTRSIYPSYVYSSGITGNGKLEENNKLQMYLTYKIIVKNESSSLYMSANEIVNYYDKSLDFVESWYEDSNGNKVNVAWTPKGETNGYNKFSTTSLKDVKIEHGQSITIYLKTKRNDILNWSYQDKIEVETYNVTEIASYSSYTKSGNNYLYYAGIDKDSAPNNIIPGRGQEYVNRYEDDTDSAPVVKIIFDEPRTISGYVFEDYTSTELNTNGERKGDGKYNASEDGYVENVKVELIKAFDNTTAYIYPNAVKDNNFNAKVAEYTTTSEGRGYYEFVGIIPGKYYLKYTYGDGSVIYKKAGGTVDVTTQDYKSTIITSGVIKTAIGDNTYNNNPKWYQNSSIQGYSTAVDDYATRKKINDRLSTITYKVKTDYENKQEDFANNYQTMTARTPNMDVAIENTNGETTVENENRTRVYGNINFGIIERPRKSVETTKEINYIKLTLANGQILVEGDPRDGSIRYVTYPKGGSLKIEVDNEIIEGATLEVTYEIKIKNKSELDYDTEKYYKYGDKSGAEAVKLTINSVIDYMDEDLKTTYTYDGNDGEWKLMNPQDLKTQGLISNNVYESIKTNHNVLVKNCDSSLSPNESMTINVSASKLLSTSKEMLYKNYAEVLKVTNSVGRFYGQINDESGNKWKNTTPGNFDPTKVKETSEEDNNNGPTAELSIIPPTGYDENKYVIGSIIGIGCLSLLVVGIVFIKKKILR